MDSYKPKTKRKTLELLSYWYAWDMKNLCKKSFRELLAIYYKKQGVSR